MGTVSTGVVDQNKEHYLRSKDKAKTPYDVLRHIQLHVSKKKKKWRFAINYCLKVDFQNWTNIQEARSYSTTSNAARTISYKAWNSTAEYPSSVARCDIKGSDGTMLNPIFWKEVQGQKLPGRWEIAERQIPSVKMLFKTNTKGHKHPSFRLFIIEQDTNGKPKKTKSGIQHRNRALPKRLWWGAASPILPILNDTPCACIYKSFNRTHTYHR